MVGLGAAEGMAGGVALGGPAGEVALGGAADVAVAGAGALLHAARAVAKAATRATLVQDLVWTVYLLSPSPSGKHGPARPFNP